DTIMAVLRRARRRVALTVACADIAGLWNLNGITQALSLFAEQALQQAVGHLLYEGHQAGEIELPDCEHPQHSSGFFVLGMGKLGARELNYSSDIDLIILFDREVVRYVGARSPQQFFVRLARKLVRILEERTGDGYVFRTDLRLRPDPGSTPPALSTEAAETYYESTGQNWERAAMIKARPVAGDRVAGDRFLDFLRPFIWRRNLDFAAIQDIHSIKRQINAVKGGTQIAIAGHNVKLGRGGIREIEFFAQTQQLIWGGRDPGLRTPETCEALRQLAEAGHIEPDVTAKLERAYEFLRTVEHRLQMIDDQQTHDIPNDPAKLENVAKFMGYEETDAFSGALSTQLHLVEDIYAGLFEESPDLAGPGTLMFTGGEDHPDTLRTLDEMGFAEPSTVAATVRMWHHGRYRALRSTRARELLTELVPPLLAALGKTLEPDAALLRFNDFLSALPAGVQLLSLLHTNPGLLELLAEIMGSAPRLSETLNRYPILFDAVLTADFFESPPNSDLLIAELDTALEQARDFQDTLDILRRQVNDRQFQIGVQILRRRLTPDQAGSALSHIADAALHALYPRLEDEFSKQHGRMKNGNMAIVALGKLGGRELTIGSDLDLLFVYQCDDEASDGPKPLPAIPYYTRFGQRYMGAITAPTGEGTLYEVDMRLRPSGNAGPLASSFDSFVRYHREDAWTWERMALTRARVIVADDVLRRHLEQSITDVLTAPRDPDGLLRDVASMRARIERDRPASGPWDVKNLRGGLVDIEFLSQYLQLRYAHDQPGIIAQNTTDALMKLRDHGAIDEKTASTLVGAMQLWRNIQGVIRLSVGENFDLAILPDGCRTFVTNVCGQDSLDTLREEILDTAETCHTIFRDLIEVPAAELPPAEENQR
ncbi:MAG: bifunctional [glutamine synthetase] adenylyltransferase/[glutamine synthetase]-adenylyl-L-tyrosine phosphorylase, partial [Rhodospirillaceae bacterium]|nr:bifunctional [glutamine synthetase] adenylyltransferase/[glutamine synthetase]-adenylyl-L-tyrosine phosphorylase [Rhodospirillaceae bacterium]